MARRKRYTRPTDRGGQAAAYSANTSNRSGEESFWTKLTKPRGKSSHMKPHELTFLLRTLSTLVDNGVSLPNALATLAKDDSLNKHKEVLETLCQKLEAGGSFSAALEQFPHVCDKLSVNQIRIGERSGTLSETLKQLSANRNKSAELRRSVLKKLAYPAMLVTLGSGLITFLLLYVVPVFQVTYDKAGVPLPWITQALLVAAQTIKSYGLILVLSVIASALLVKQLRKQDQLACWMDRRILKLPLFGSWLRDMAVLQLMEVLNNLMAAGYTLVDALGQTADSVSNRAVRQGVAELQSAVKRGERFSHELERQTELFPPIVNQLVIVGESTGQLTRSTRDICDHLRTEIQRKTSLTVGALEPILTISLAGAIAVVLLAIYLPMFDMVNTIT